MQDCLSRVAKKQNYRGKGVEGYEKGQYSGRLIVIVDAVIGSGLLCSKESRAMLLG